MLPFTVHPVLVSALCHPDVAISAPFGAGSGTVYVYHSSASQLLNPVPQQVRVCTCVSFPIQTGIAYSICKNTVSDQNWPGVGISIQL